MVFRHGETALSQNIKNRLDCVAAIAVTGALAVGSAIL
jgi:hypothetical protein